MKQQPTSAATGHLKGDGACLPQNQHRQVNASSFTVLLPIRDKWSRNDRYKLTNPGQRSEMPSGSPPSLYECTHYVLHSTHHHLKQLICVPVKPLHTEGEQSYLMATLAGVPSASLPGGRPDARQSNELPGVWKRLEPGSAPTSGPLPFPATLRGAAGYEGLPVGREKSPSPRP
ncbi:unnamed protein product [Rangifer tarandus platyrhynchus]|uniref:Uncharacterized protein n=1 Tax=Rangifer tarandus platyrhynchus TaxID=3082113 RepID=A0AC59YWN9_RANTA